MAAAECRSFTIRVPLEVYFELSRRAASDDVHLNAKVNQVIALGLDRCITLDEALLRLLKRMVLESGDTE